MLKPHHLPFNTPNFAGEIPHGWWNHGKSLFLLLNTCEFHVLLLVFSLFLAEILWISHKFAADLPTFWLKSSSPHFFWHISQSPHPQPLAAAAGSSKPGASCASSRRWMAMSTEFRKPHIFTWKKHWIPNMDVPKHGCKCAPIYGTPHVPLNSHQILPCVSFTR